MGLGIFMSLQTELMLFSHILGVFLFLFNGVGIFVGRGRIFVDKGRILQVELNSLGHLMGWFKNGNFVWGLMG